MRQIALVFTLLVTLFIFGCGGDETVQPANACIEGTSQGCVCTNGANGAQTCNADGTFEPCLCDGPVADAGNDAATRNACGGGTQLSASPGEGCGDCGDGVLVCDGVDALRCIGATERNACGGCGILGGRPDETCGQCGGGVWSCTDDLAAVTCVGETPLNTCGGCTPLSGSFLDDCPDGPGYLSCTSSNELTCVPLDANACGGTGPLSGRPASACGECLLGKYSCDGTDDVSCDDSGVERNACGGCGDLAAQPGDSCGSCGGTVVCDGSERTRCDITYNPCGGCRPLADLPGSPCAGGIVVCDGTGGTVCSTDAANACGGTQPLAATPGDDCGSCGDGIVVCAGRDITACVGASPLNACGGCDALAHRPGDVCGPQDVFACDGGDTLVCVDRAALNACGGTAQLNGEPGDPCGDCGTYRCAAGDNALECTGEDTDPDDRLNCEACGMNCSMAELCVNSACVGDTPAGWVDIEVGRAHGCALTSTGEVWCWGDNTGSQLGLQGVAGSNEPRLVLRNASDIAVASDFSCALDAASGTPSCWGTVTHSDLVDAVGSTFATPTAVVGMTGLTSIDAGGETVCGIDALTSVRCWGANDSGQLGTGATSVSESPGSMVSGLTGATIVTVGGSHACALRNTNTIWCWGANASGEAGQGSTSTTASPGAVDNSTTLFDDVDAGTDHTCALASGAVWCWGENASSQAGVSSNPITSPASVGENAVDLLATGDATTFAHRNSFDETRVWGATAYGRLGNEMGGGGAGSTTPVNQGTIYPSDAIDIDSEGGWGCVLLTDSIYCWGAPPRLASSDYPSVLLDGQVEPASPRYVPTRSPYVGTFPGEYCFDGIDNDGDTLIDCLDPDCAIPFDPASSPTLPPFDSSDGNYHNVASVCGGDQGGIDKFFLWTAPASGNFAIYDNSTSFDRYRFAILTNCSPNRVERACHDTNSAMMMQGTNEFPASMGDTFVVVVELDGPRSYFPTMFGQPQEEYGFTIQAVP